MVDRAVSGFKHKKSRTFCPAWFLILPRIGCGPAIVVGTHCGGHLDPSSGGDWQVSSVNAVAKCLFRVGRFFFFNVLQGLLDLLLVFFVFLSQ